MTNLDMALLIDRYRREICRLCNVLKLEIIFENDGVIWRIRY